MDSAQRQDSDFIEKSAHNNASHLLHYLTAVSGKLPFQKTTNAAATAGLGIVAAWLQKKGCLKQSVLVPIDPHAHLFTSPSARASQWSRQRCDLALFSFQPNILEVTFIEVKWRKNHETLDVLGSSMYIQMKSSRQAFQERFFRSEPLPANTESDRNDCLSIGSGHHDESRVPIQEHEKFVQRSYLASVLVTYLEHACRYGLFDEQAKQTFLGYLANFKINNLEFRGHLEGYIVSLSDPSASFAIMDANIHLLTAADFESEGLALAERSRDSAYVRPCSA